MGFFNSAIDVLQTPRDLQLGAASVSWASSTCLEGYGNDNLARIFMYGKEEAPKKEINRQHHTIPTK